MAPRKSKVAAVTQLLRKRHNLCCNHLSIMSPRFTLATPFAMWQRTVEVIGNPDHKH